MTITIKSWLLDILDEDQVFDLFTIAKAEFDKPDMCVVNSLLWYYMSFNSGKLWQTTECDLT